MEVIVKQNGYGIEINEAMTLFKLEKEKNKDVPYEERTLAHKLANRFSGGYWSPTFIKSWDSCPAKCFLESMMPREESLYANIGSCTHKIYENFVKEGVLSLDNNKIVKITEKEIDNFNTRSSESDIHNYVNSFCKMRDYNNEKLFDWENVESYPEAFYKDEITMFDCYLGPLYCLIDRIDIREDGIYIVDYKTGNPKWFNKDTFVDLYTNQFIAYKWIIEKKYGFPIKGAYAYLPSFNKHIEMPVNSMENQSRLVEQVLIHYDNIKQQNNDGVYKEIPGTNCRYCKFKNKCNANNKTDVKDEIKFYI